MSRVDKPREYSARVLSSKPSKRRCPFLTICGSKLPLGSLGVSIRTGPCSVASDFPVEPLLVLPVPPGGSWCGS